MRWLNTWVVSTNLKPKRGGLWSPFLMLLLCFSLHAEPPILVGQHYIDLAPKQAAPQPLSAVRVDHWFWYGCASCRLFAEKNVAMQAMDVVWHSHPAQLRADWYFHAKAYYLAGQQINAEALQQALFAQINQAPESLITLDELVHWFSEHGLKPEEVEEQLTSPWLNETLRNDRDLQQQWSLRGVPALIIDQRYLVDAGMVSSMEEFIRVGQFLLDKARQQRQVATP